jgi:hypothetical protein
MRTVLRVIYSIRWFIFLHDIYIAGGFEDCTLMRE